MSFDSLPWCSEIEGGPERDIDLQKRELPADSFSWWLILRVLEAARASPTTPPLATRPDVLVLIVP